MNTLATVMYRNPLEEWLWESGAMAWIIGIGGVVVLLFALVIWWEDRRNRK